MTNENKDEKTFTKKDWTNLIAIFSIFLGFYYFINGNLNDIKKDIRDLRIELKGDISELRTELKGDISELRKDVNDLQQRMAVVETVLKINYGFAQKPCYEEK